jgi:hypothetical protein
MILHNFLCHGESVKPIGRPEKNWITTLLLAARDDGNL